MRTTRQRALLATVAAIVGLALLAGACSSASDNADDTTGTSVAPNENIGLVEEDGPGTPGGGIAYGLSAETDGWNPTNSRWATSGLEVAKSIYDTLAAYDADQQWKPNLAESFEPNDDFTVWTVTIREGVTYHNGVAVTGETVARGLNLIKDSPLTAQPFEPVVSIEPSTEDPMAVVVTMEEPWANWPYAMTTQVGVVAEPDWLASGDTREPIGTGPFVFQDWVPGDKLTVVKNDSWWREGYPLLDQVDFLPVPDELTRSNLLQQGEIDIMNTTSGTQVAKFKDLAREGEGYQVVNDPEGESVEVFVMLNTKAAPLDDPRARQALAYATDAQSYVDVLGQGQFALAEGPFAEGSPWYAETDYPGYDPAQAQALVDEVKADNGGEFAVTLSSVPSPQTNDGVQLLQSQWEQVGIDVTIETVDQAQLIAEVVAGNYQATIWTQFDSPHPLGDSIWWHPDAASPIGEFGLNFARNENPEIGAALDAARQATDREEEQAYYQEVMRLLAQDVPYVWLYHSPFTIVATTDLVNIVNYTLPDGSQGLPLHGGAHPLWQIWRTDGSGGLTPVHVGGVRSRDAQRPAPPGAGRSSS